MLKIPQLFRTSAPVSLSSLIEQLSIQIKPRDEVFERIPYQPRGNAARLPGIDRTEILLSGPAGTGKSRAALEYFHESAEKYPRSRYLIVRKTRESLTQSGLVTFEEY